MRKNILLLFFIVMHVHLFAQPSFITDSLDSYIQQGMKDWNIPGLAIAIVKDGKTVVMKGYGVKNLQTNEPVDSLTLFMIASNTKLFTGTALAQLEYDKKLSLSDKIIKYFPDYKLYDSFATKEVTIQDMLGHHLGTKTFQGDFTFWNSSLSRKDILYKMRFLQPVQPFRASYGYCNSCFLTAGEVIQLVSGKPWEVYVYDSLIMPLGMTHTHTLSYGMQQMPNVATPYSNSFADNLYALPYDNIDNLAPAGSMVSCVSDIAHWLLMQLDSGKYSGKTIVPWPVVQKTRDGNTIIATRKSSWLPTHFMAYGLGVFERDYAGKQVFEHTGGADGFVSNVCFVPEENLGITILTNNDNQAFFELLRYQILNAYLNVPYENLSKKRLHFFLQERAANLAQLHALQNRVKEQLPSLPFSAYTGMYKNALYGEISIQASGNDLIIDFKGHKNLKALLQYMDNDEWLMKYSNPAYGIFPIKFQIKNKKINSVEIKMNDFIEYDSYLFTKQ